MTYYRNLALPVLMVRYVASTGTVYTRWAHSLDTYGKDADWKTATFRWEEEDAWSDSRPAELVAEARAFLELRSSSVSFPIGVHGDLQPPGSWGFGADEIRLALMRQIVPRADLLRLEPGDARPGAGILVVRDDRLAVELARVTAATAHLDERFQPEGPDRIARDLLALCALAFERFGQLRAAGLLAMAYLPGSSVLDHEAGVLALQSAMAASRQVTESLPLAEALDQGDEASRALGQMFLLVTLHHSATLSDFERQAYRDVMKRRIARRGESTDAARETMNLAQFELVSGNPGEAVQLHERVIELDPSYEQRPHYKRERAGALSSSQSRSRRFPAERRAIRLLRMRCGPRPSRHTRSWPTWGTSRAIRLCSPMR